MNYGLIKEKGYKRQSIWQRNKDWWKGREKREKD